MPTGKRNALIVALLTSPSLKAAARKADVAYRTAVRWHAEEAFQKELATAKAAAFGQALAVVHGASARAAATLLRNLRADKAADRTSAARTLLEFAFQVHKDETLAAKLHELEQLLRKVQDERKRQDR